MTSLSKTALRDQMRAQRAALSAQDPDAGETLAETFPMKLLQRYGPQVAAYLPIGSEIDPRPLMRRLEAAGACLSLPCVLEGGAMVYRAYSYGDMLERRAFGLLEPQSGVPDITPTLILAPLLAFDALGNRLGYGKGHYDRAIGRLRQSGRVFVCGLAFQGQQLEAVPAEQHDVPLDWAVTECGSVPIFMMRTFQAGASAKS